jgi:hypothetical protein
MEQGSMSTEAAESLRNMNGPRRFDAADLGGIDDMSVTQLADLADITGGAVLNDSEGARLLRFVRSQFMEAMGVWLEQNVVTEASNRFEAAPERSTFWDDNVEPIADAAPDSYVATMMQQFSDLNCETEDFQEVAHAGSWADAMTLTLSTVARRLLMGLAEAVVEEYDEWLEALPERHIQWSLDGIDISTSPTAGDDADMIRAWVDYEYVVAEFEYGGDGWVLTGTDNPAVWDVATGVYPSADVAMEAIGIDLGAWGE